MIPRILSVLILAAFTIGASAADLITATITLTNLPAGPTNTLTINGSTRTWTNSTISSPSTLIHVTNAIPLSATNLLNHLSLYPAVAGQRLSQGNATNVVIVGLPGYALAVSSAGGWASIALSTNSTVTNAFAVRVPITVEAPTNQTNIASYLASALNLSTNAIATNAITLSNYLTRGASAVQTVASPVTFAGAVRIFDTLNATNGNWATGSLFYPTLHSPSLSNATIFGNTTVTGASINLIGSGANNFISLTATGTLAAVGSIMYMARENGITNAVDAGDVLGIFGFTGYGTTAQKVGARIRAIPMETFTDSTAGTILLVETTPSGSTTPVGRLHIGDTGNVTVTNVFRAGSVTNATLTGTNVINGRLDLTAGLRTGLANGYNSGTVIGTNVYLRMSGPTAAYTNAGFAASVDGTWHKLQFDNPGLSYTVLDSSGLEATAANRILTGTGALINSTNNPAFLEMIYDGSASRWRVISFR